MYVRSSITAHQSMPFLSAFALRSYVAEIRSRLGRWKCYDCILDLFTFRVRTIVVRTRSALVKNAEDTATRKMFFIIFYIFLRLELFKGIATAQSI